MLSQQARAVSSICLILSVVTVDAGRTLQLTPRKSSLPPGNESLIHIPAPQAGSQSQPSLEDNVKLRTAELDTSVESSEETMRRGRSGVSLHLKSSDHAQPTHKTNILQEGHRRLTASLQMTPWGNQSASTIQEAPVETSDATPEEQQQQQQEQQTEIILSTSEGMSHWGEQESTNESLTLPVLNATVPTTTSANESTAFSELTPWGHQVEEDSSQTSLVKNAGTSSNYSLSPSEILETSTSLTNQSTGYSELIPWGQQVEEEPNDSTSVTTMEEPTDLEPTHATVALDLQTRTRMIAAGILAFLAISLILDILGICSMQRILCCRGSKRTLQEHEREAILASVYERAAARNLKAMNPPGAKCVLP